MRVQNFATPGSLSFCRALTGAEEKDFSKVTVEAQKALGVNDGMSLFKVFSQSLPTGSENTGIGKINSDSALEYLKFMKLYTGCNGVKIYPIGQFMPKKDLKGYYCPYLRSGVTIGADNINYFKLQESQYGAILPTDKMEYMIGSRVLNRVDYENELDDETGYGKKLLDMAYENLYELQTPEAKNLRAEFESYKASLSTDTLDRLAIAPFVRESDPDLFKGFSSSKEKQQRFDEYKEQYARDIDLFKFSKFLALKNLKEAKENLEKEGLELYGDCPIGWSDDEVFAFPDAFYPPEISPGWGFRAIKYDEIPKNGSEAQKLFREKIAWHLENFDGIRFDAGWQYFSPKLQKNERFPYEINVQNGITDFIEKTAKEIKGDDYDTKKLLYECDANAEDFQMFDWKDDKAKVLDKMKGKTPVLTSVYEHGNGFGWGNPAFFDRAGMEDYILGTNNHDSTPLRILAEDDFDDCGDRIVDLRPVRQDNLVALNKSLGLSYEFLSDAKNFVKAKFAELFLAKNRFLFFNDVMGLKERTDAESSNPENYRIKISNDYEKEFHEALQDGRGFNLAQSLQTAMKAKNLDKTNPELYKKVAKYCEILSQKGPKTKAEAEKAFICNA